MMQVTVDLEDMPMVQGATLLQDVVVCSKCGSSLGLRPDEFIPGYTFLTAKYRCVCGNRVTLVQHKLPGWELENAYEV